MRIEEAVWEAVKIHAIKSRVSVRDVVESGLRVMLGQAVKMPPLSPPAAPVAGELVEEAMPCRRCEHRRKHHVPRCNQMGCSCRGFLEA